VILDRLRGGLIVSIQPEAGSVLNTPATVALLARCALANGAAGVRIEGGERIAAVRAAIDAPIIGLVKRAYPGFGPYITPTLGEVDEIVAAGAAVVAFDATDRTRPAGDSVADLVGAIHARGAVAMADCATAAELLAAAAAGADIVATTLAGYTDDTRGRSLPALDLVAGAAAGGSFVILEGGVATPSQARAGIAAGAGAVVVGTALSNLDALVRSFATGVAGERRSPV
jgi:putative N-acetylmannosamine-6-phosphate epimerase